MEPDAERKADAHLKKMIAQRGVDPAHVTQLVVQVLPDSNPSCRSFRIVHRPPKIVDLRASIVQWVSETAWMQQNIHDGSFVEFEDEDAKREALQTHTQELKDVCTKFNFAFANTDAAIREQDTHNLRLFFWVTVLDFVSNNWRTAMSEHAEGIEQSIATCRPEDVATMPRGYYLYCSSRRALQIFEASDVTPQERTRAIVALLNNTPLLPDEELWRPEGSALAIGFLVARHMLRREIALVVPQLVKKIQDDCIVTIARQTFGAHLRQASQGFVEMYVEHRLIYMLMAAQTTTKACAHGLELRSMLDAMSDMILGDLFHVIDTAINITASCRECLMCYAQEYEPRMAKMERCECRFYCNACATATPNVLKGFCPIRKCAQNMPKEKKSSAAQRKV